MELVVALANLTGVFQFVGFGFLALGVLWAPFGGLICQRLSSRIHDSKRLDVVDGAIVALHLLLPWIYQWSLLRGKPLSNVTIRRGYIAFFIVWFVGTVGSWLVRIVRPFFRESEDFHEVHLFDLSPVPAVIFVAFSGLLWYWALSQVVEFHRSRRYRSLPSDPFEIPAEYLRPFKIAAAVFLSMLVWWFIWGAIPYWLVSL